ncbi:MAG TPA: LysM peptidoglycan-binding domain-containing protein [Arthrobacter sp.]|nr:LysM peptidoglycan-binding domain-containing protein [Arthrobacter sp.]
MSAQLAPQSADFRANAPLRLTRRGRLLLIGLPLMLAAAVALTLVGFFTAPAMAAAGGLGPGPAVTVTVGSGQTLWDVAVLTAPDRNPHDVIFEIAQLNGLDGDIVHSGQQLLVPSTH